MQTLVVVECLVTSDQKKNRIVTGSSPVTTQVPHAVGIALAWKNGEERFSNVRYIWRRFFKPR